MAETVRQTYELVKLDELHEHPDNPREGDVGVIHESIKANGFYGALVVQRSTGRILAGNHRFKAAKQAKMRELPAIVVDVDDETAQRILLVDNRANDLASYDESKLASMLVSMDELVGTGYTQDDLEKMLRDLNEGLRFDEDAPSEDLPRSFGVVIECDDEIDQVGLLQRFAAEGLRVKALVS